MVGRAVAVVLTATQTDAEQVATAINEEMVARNPVNIDVTPFARQARGRWIALVLCDFDTITAARNFLTALRNRIETSPLAEPGSRILVHRCRHEEGEGDCTIAESTVWVKP